MGQTLMEGAMYMGAGVVTVSLTDRRTRRAFECAYSVN